MTELLSGKDLCMFRGDRCLFTSLNFALHNAELLVIEGANGSGKTSLLRGIAGLLEFEEGHIARDGEPVRRNLQAYRAEFVWLAHKIGIKSDLNLVDNLRFEASLRQMDEAKTADVLERLELTALTELPVRALSAGQQRRIALARLLLSRAPIWMMDEPFTNLDRDGRALVSELIAEHLGEGGGCVVATHQPLEIDAKSQRIELS